MISPLDYFQSYISNYYDFKIEMFNGYVSKIRELETGKKDSAYRSMSKRTKVLKAEVRQTYFHSIETLFEMIFALLPNEKGIIKDEEMMLTITNSGLKYDKIVKIAKDEGNDILDQVTSYRVTDPIPIVQYIFYFGIDSDKFLKMAPESTSMEDSIQRIKKILKTLAADLSNRTEYNSYKHGLRLISHLNSFEIENTKDGDKLEFDISDSMTYIVPNKKTPESIEIVTRVFDTERDISRIGIISKLIQNIINTRKYFLGDKKEIVELPLYLINPTEEERFFQAKPNLSVLSFKSEPIQD